MEQESPTTFLAQLTERMAIDGAPASAAFRFRLRDGPGGGAGEPHHLPRAAHRAHGDRRRATQALRSGLGLGTVQAVEQESLTTFLAQLTERMAIDSAPARRCVQV